MKVVKNPTKIITTVSIPSFICITVISCCLHYLTHVSTICTVQLHTNTLIHTHTTTHSHTYQYTHKHCETHSLIHSHTHSHTHSFIHSISHSLNHPINQSINQPINPSIHHSINLSIPFTSILHIHNHQTSHMEHISQSNQSLLQSHPSTYTTFPPSIFIWQYVHL